MTIYDRIKDRRTALGLSQEELANRLGLSSRAAVSAVERGKCDMTTDRISRYAEALDTTPAYLMGWVDGPEDKIEPEVEYKEPELPSFNLSDEELLIAMAYSRADTTTKNGVRALLELPFIPVDKEIEEEELPRLKAPDEYKTYYPIVDPNTGETRQIEIVTEMDKLKHRNLVRLAEIGVIPKHPRVKRLRDIRKKEKV